MSDFPIRIIRARRRTLSIHILPDGSVVVSAPLLTSSGTIQRFLDEKHAWIEKHLAVVKKQLFISKRAYRDGERFLFLGQSYTLHFGNYTRITLKNSELCFPQFLAFRVKKELHEWYVKEARTVISDRVVANALQMNVHYKSISFSDTKSKWGSCTHDNRLQFNWRLIMSPIIVINYVVVHELAHIMEKNHSDVFWTKVRNINPSYRQQIKWLKEHGNALSLE